jgi:hypothetical protein
VFTDPLPRIARLLIHLLHSNGCTLYSTYKSEIKLPLFYFYLIFKNKLFDSEHNSQFSKQSPWIIRLYLCGNQLHYTRFSKEDIQVIVFLFFNTEDRNNKQKE